MKHESEMSSVADAPARIVIAAWIGWLGLFAL